MSYEIFQPNPIWLSALIIIFQLLVITILAWILFLKRKAVPIYVLITGTAFLVLLTWVLPFSGLFEARNHAKAYSDYINGKAVSYVGRILENKVGTTAEYLQLENGIKLTNSLKDFCFKVFKHVKSGSDIIVSFQYANFYDTENSYQCIVAYDIGKKP